jgi:hypothetical protein
MLIRSQDKRAIVNLDDIAEIYTNIVNPRKEIKEKYETEIKYHSGALNNRYLGTYSTEEKAIKVLDMIQEKYETYIGVTNGFNGIQGCYNMPKVFQMPQDSEV